MVRCHEVMTENPVCCLSRDLVEGIAQWMRTESIGAMLVVEDYQTKKLLGIVTDRDLALRVIGARLDPGETRTGDVMTPNPVTCLPDDDLDTALHAMAHYQVRRIPVADLEGRLLGIISQADIVTRISDPRKIADVLQKISQPAPTLVQG